MSVITMAAKDRNQNTAAHPTGEQPDYACETCCHWEPGAGASRGTCRHSSPRSQVVMLSSDELEVRAIWPMTAASDWCGAWLSPEDLNRRVLRRLMGPPIRPTEASTVRGGG